MDSLTAHYVARELDARWRDRRIAACTMDRATRSVRLAVEASAPVRIELASPSPRVVEGAAERHSAGLLDGWFVRSVAAPSDDRRLLIDVEKPGKFRGSVSRTAAIEVGLMPSARSAVIRESSGHRLAMLGAELPAVSTPRPLLDAAALRGVAERGDVQALMASRWMSPWLARWLTGDPHRASDVAAVLAELPAPRPSRCGPEVIPFPWCTDPVPCSSLVAPRAAPPAIESSRREDWRERALERMRRELSRAAEAPRLREAADALLSLGEVDAPAAVALADGTLLQLDVHPGDTAVVVAERLYAAVRSMERALASLPARITETESAAGRDTQPRRENLADTEAWAHERAYRRYRSSGGLEIWVGRGAKSNDLLTFRDASPDDVWLHARDSAGAHVVLRWQADGAPPARDLEEAATLAAWHSKARGSTVVPVDWTRRKYVRKPRGGAAGLVILQRAETVFVRPSADAERRLRTSA